MDATTAQAWAELEFGRATLGDARRTKRLVEVAAAVATQPSGTVTGTFRRTAEREGAYRLLEKQSHRAPQVEAASGVAALARARDYPYVLVPEDGTSVNLGYAPTPTGGFGRVGPKGGKAQGLTVMNAVVLSPGGTPLGVAAQDYWARDSEERTSSGKTRCEQLSRPFEDKETLHWLTCAERSLQRAHEAGFEGALWFQMDRGGDFSHALLWAASQPLEKVWTTIRAAYNRNTLEDAGLGKLWGEVQASPCLGIQQVDVPARQGKPARLAQLEVRAVPVAIKLRRRIVGTDVPVPFYAVYAREVGYVPKGGERLEWMLLSTCPRRGWSGARRVLRAYTHRWRLEEIHKTWKSGSMAVEDSQLESAKAFELWARILFAAAVRAERLKRLARESPNLPAEAEFSKTELDAMELLMDKDPRYPGRDGLTLGQAVECVAFLGGYTSRKSSGGPPGTITIRRGLERLLLAAEVLCVQARKRQGKM
jgi:hypothetical protein